MSTLGIIHIIVSILLILAILLQQRDSEVSGFLGGTGGGGGAYQQRRGFEKILFYGTIVLVVAFAGLAIVNLFIAGPVVPGGDINATSTGAVSTSTPEAASSTPSGSNQLGI